MPKQPSDEPKKKTIYTLKLSEEELSALHKWLKDHQWGEYHVDHARFAYKGDKVNVVGYNSLKVVIQGKNMEHFVQFVLEPEITKAPKLGYDEVLHPQWFEEHGGLDESGKGDLFGPLVSACVLADKPIIDHWVASGIQDSKRITSDAAILKFDKIIRATKGAVIKTTFANMRKYNELYVKFGENLNKLLAWMHSKSLEDALKVKRVPWAMLDQFSKQPLVQAYFKDDPIDLRMETKAESDPVVAAASIVARAEYVRQMRALSEKSGMELKKGASAQVKEQGKELVKKFGPDALGDYAKLHFRTAFEVLGLPVPEKKPWQKW